MQPESVLSRRSSVLAEFFDNWGIVALSNSEASICPDAQRHCRMCTARGHAREWRCRRFRPAGHAAGDRPDTLRCEHGQGAVVSESVSLSTRDARHRLWRRRPRQDSNLCTRLRRPVLYPLSYGDMLGIYTIPMPERARFAARFCRPVL
jgi:hypothetical protein